MLPSSHLIYLALIPAEFPKCSPLLGFGSPSNPSFIFHFNVNLMIPHAASKFLMTPYYFLDKILSLQLGIQASVSGPSHPS